MTRYLELFWRGAALALLAGSVARAAPAENTTHRQELLEHAFQHPAATSSRAATHGYIPTNTLAFREYSLRLMLAEANSVRNAWGLDLPSPITSDHLTRLAATPTVIGVAGGITISNRYYFGFTGGRFSAYHDALSWWQGLERNLPKQRDLSKERSLISEREASEIADQALRGLGIAPPQLGLMDKPAVERFYTLDDSDIRLPLPLFLASWKVSPSAQFGGIRLEVSGLSRKVVSYENAHLPASPLPTNYFQMLGVSSDRGTWGKRFGYDPRHTATFEHRACEVAVAEANHLIRALKLDFPRLLATNDISWSLISPGSNVPRISVRFTNRFYVQMLDGYVSLFEDHAHYRSSFAEDSKLNSIVIMTNVLDESAAIRLARDAVRALGLDEKQLRLREPPTVARVDFPSETSDKTVKLPLYDVFWYFPPDQQPRFADAPAIGVQVSAVTKRVAMFANNCPWTPKLSPLTNFWK